ncbi:MAG: hypothetical protein KC582_03285 [Candidatus Magasanikbacteria bacterium]|nr:hypothetical protein [Candidatus Magasanikbacteria bacterium]MCA9391252.1 hypothetical protein [Candidatus Magasanikbacteria bacterium]USN52773.1 MAG: hypothetical protein H6759_01745 [Candidatus Nomurabacteria bacterium]HPF95330.1 hypothetical protein [bacterium]
MRYRPAFNALEAIIVVAVFGLFATLATLSLNSARASARDAQRLSDIGTLRASLGQYWLEKATYPISDSIELGKPGSNADMLTANGFIGRQTVQGPTYLDRVPTPPKSGEYYRYRGGSNGYAIRFKTETKTELGEPNVYYAHATGIDGEDTDR